MSDEQKKMCSKVKLKQPNINIVDFLSKRSINGYRDDSKNFTSKLFDTAKDLYKKDLTAHFGCVNAIEFSGDGNLLFSGGDDRRVLMWNTNDAMIYYNGKLGQGAKPAVMKGRHYSNVFCLAVDDGNKRVFSGSNDDQVIVHDYTTGSPVDIFLHDSPVFSLSLHPDNGNIFASAANNGRILIYDIRESNTDLLCVAKLRTPFHGVMFNPCEPLLIATANSKVGVHIWDLRKPKEILIKCNDEPSMAVRWNQYGTILLALRNLLPIVIYDPLVPKRKLEFDSGAYFNACTMKSCSFAGTNDEYILSGSDDFNLYMWKIPEPWPESKWIDNEHLTLTGHRSIVNQVRYSSSKHLIATSGVEKIIKLWSPFRLPYSEGDRDRPSSKRHRVLCSSRSCTRSPGFLSHDYSQESMDEDTKMIHFFDTLLQKELDDVPDSFYMESNLFTVSRRKKETRLYEKLIRKKKKYLSKILIEKSSEKKPVCSINEAHQKIPSSTSTASSADIGECTPMTRTNQITRLSIRNQESSTDASTSNSLANDTSSSSKSSTTKSSGVQNVSSKLSKGPAGCFKRVVDYSSSDDTNVSISDKQSNNLKDSGLFTMSESSDSEKMESCVFLKRKCSSSTRCYRNRTRRKKRRMKSPEDSSEDSSDSESYEDNKRKIATKSSRNGGENVDAGNSTVSSDPERAAASAGSSSRAKDV
ncbi:hypothetical protein RUM44_001457 [Polyplax serrata]|uniref:Uncharacterized protein n=1 Tax=Polyplax serrata TaxID=468196 RepID=A0ABR1AK54_POLSC